MIELSILEKLNVPEREARLENLRAITEKAAFPTRDPRYINNHIHTTFSFSPYSPTAAVYAAAAEGLCTAGIVDHDTMAGAREFLEAAKILKMPVTVGMECRVSLAGTPFENRRLNNPDQTGVAYVTIQSVPHGRIEDMTEFFAPYRARREARNRRVLSRLAELLPEYTPDYDRDVLPLTMQAAGGTVTERHLLFALARNMTVKLGRGEKIASVIEENGVELSEKQREKLHSDSGFFYEYDLLGILKSAFLPRIYLPATDECPTLAAVVEKCREVDAFLCYAYLGDIAESVTGDKRAQKFEDDILEELFSFLKKNGVNAVTYMPTRNTETQLRRLRSLCEEYGMFQISGEDINSPSQSFVIRAMEDSQFANLIDATWALIEHENKEV